MYVYFVLGVGGYKIHKSMEIILYASITFKDMCDSSGIFSDIVFSSPDMKSSKVAWFPK